MITLIKTVRTVAGDKAKTLVLPIALSCADSLLHMGMFAVMIAAIINLVAGAFNAELLAFYSGALVVLFVVRAALYVTNYAQTQFRGADITADLRLSIGNHLRRLNLGYFDKNSIGQLASVLTTDVSDFEQTITTSLASFFKVVCFSVLACAFAFAINWLYGLIILAIVVASLPLARLGGRAASKGGVRYRESVHAVISRIIEYINGIKTFKLYNLTGRRFERLDRSFADLKRESIRMELSIMPFSVLFSVATSLIVPLGLVAGTLMFMDGQLDAPRLIAAVMIAVSISSMMTTLGVIYPELNYLAKAAEGIERIQAERPLAYRDGNPRFTSFDVRFDDVRFGYADGKEVLHGVTFTAQPGTRTALVGPSGSGKTTVISLISRFWDASSGSVRVGGHEVRDIAPDALAEQVAVVFQDVYLLADTVANNIRVGKPDATQEEVEAAARAAHCHDFIEALPQGYDTLVGEGGSTGRRCRAARSSASPSRERSSRTLPSCCWTSRPRAWTPTTSTRSTGRSTCSWRTRPSSSSPTAWTPWSAPIRYWCWTTVAYASGAPTTSCSRRAAGTPTPSPNRKKPAAGRHKKHRKAGGGKAPRSLGNPRITPSPTALSPLAGRPPRRLRRLCGRLPRERPCRRLGR